MSPAGRCLPGHCVHGARGVGREHGAPFVRRRARGHRGTLQLRRLVPQPRSPVSAASVVGVSRSRSRQSESVVAVSIRRRRRSRCRSRRSRRRAGILKKGCKAAARKRVRSSASWSGSSRVYARQIHGPSSSSTTPQTPSSSKASRRAVGLVSHGLHLVPQPALR